MSASTPYDEEEIDWEQDLPPATQHHSNAARSYSTAASAAIHSGEYSSVVVSSDDDNDDNGLDDANITSQPAARVQPVPAAEIAAAFIKYGKSSTTASTTSTGPSIQQDDAAMMDVNEEEKEKEGDLGDDDGEEDEDEDEEEEDDELGPRGAGDRAFQESLLRDNNTRSNNTATKAASAASAPTPIEDEDGEKDLLSAILSGRATTRETTTSGRGKRNSGSKDVDNEEKDDAHDHTDQSVLANDTLDYQIYCDRFLDSTSPTSLSDAIIGFSALRLGILQYVAPYTNEYMWQKDAFGMEVCAVASHRNATATSSRATTSSTIGSSASNHSLLIPHLHGQLHFSDNLTDEWFAIWLLLQISSHFPSLSICVRDSDGEPICIECADALPEDASSPQQAKNRIWIRRGMIHIIPKPVTPKQVADWRGTRMSVEMALQIMKQGGIRTQADGAVQQVLLKKFHHFTVASRDPLFLLPSTSLSALHHVRVLLPLSCALLLEQYPQLASSWIYSLVMRDTMDMKRGNKMEVILGGKRKSKVMDEGDADMKAAPSAIASSSSSSASAVTETTTPPSLPIIPFVWTRLTLTHCLYSQLHTPFSAPRVFQRHISSTLSSADGDGRGATNPVYEKGVDIGVKLAVGAEMWLANKRGEMEHRRKRYELHLKKQKPAASSSSRVVEQQQLRNQVAATLDQIMGHKRRFLTLKQIESFLSASSTTSSFVASWRIFHSLALEHDLTALCGIEQNSTAINREQYYHLLLITFLHATYSQHQCVDYEDEDEARVDIVLEERLYATLIKEGVMTSSPMKRYRPTSSIRVPHDLAVVKELMTACEYTATADPAPALAVSSSPSFASSTTVAALLSNTFYSLPRDDSEDWMHVTPADLEKMMNEAGGSSRLGDTMDDINNGNSSSHRAYDGETIVKSMNQFVEKMSDIEGVVAPSKDDSTSAMQLQPVKPPAGIATKPLTSSLSTAASASLAAAPLKSILKKPVESAPKFSSSSSSSKPRELDIDPDELMRLLSSAGDIIPPSADSSQQLAKGFNEHILRKSSAASSSSASAAASIHGQLPLSDSEEDSDTNLLPDDYEDTIQHNNQSRSSNAPPKGATIVMEDDDDFEAPNATNTRPPMHNKYDAWFNQPEQKSNSGSEDVDMDVGEEEKKTSLPTTTTTTTINVPTPSASHHAHTPAHATATRVVHLPTAVATDAAKSNSSFYQPSQSQQQQKEPQKQQKQQSQQQPNLRDYMDAMDEELKSSGLAASFVRGDGTSATDSAASTSSSPSDPINIDVNLLSNMLQSHEAEYDASAISGGAQMHGGPVTSIMASMGMRMPSTEETTKQQK